MSCVAVQPELACGKRSHAVEKEKEKGQEKNERLA